MDKNAQVVDNSAIKRLPESTNEPVISGNSPLRADQFRHLWKMSDN